MLRLYSFWRSSCSYRVRIALGLKGLAYETVPVHLFHDGGQQHRPEYRDLNPQAMVPTLVDGDLRLSQSLAILFYLDRRQPEPPLLPADPALAAQALQTCLTIVADIQPKQNSGLLAYLTKDFGFDKTQCHRWARHWITVGLDALELRLQAGPRTRFSHGEAPGMADCCLIPQLHAARRFDCELTRWPRLLDIEEACLPLPAFADAQPDRQPDAPRT